MAVASHSVHLSIVVICFIALTICWSLWTVSSALSSPSFLQETQRTKHHTGFHIHRGESRFWHDHDRVSERILPPKDAAQHHHLPSNPQTTKKHAPINYIGLNHINIVVDDLEKAASFYEHVLGFKPAWGFTHFRNAGMARAIGFSNADAARVDVSIKVMNVPGAAARIELMQFHSPETTLSSQPNLADLWEAGQGVGHVCLKVKDIQRAFKHLKKYEVHETDTKGAMGVKFISDDPNYGPFQLDPADPEVVEIFHPKATKGDLYEQKAALAELMGRVSSLYFSDPYGVRWVLDQVES
mmetsp:Transcript_27180/g.59401  ORF Transcript_27180/g.59401 Transcript_27180/m.59401 type:complete len:298 (-) Transcript_27180:201-1094(-)|eukprot:CAMPEP_0118941332 /NCGR_PEP_ID=MMETSP1169-20130426/33609_1 /TAXON_ID=36882 /ORGANISM="Pyramimonas obovata, Strain CCMP722" /LENGTH=297 /DNA_ID=CAMNT_0006886051 /DNA_START=128 /DNA_END=1021 /DNA_ORIENTATION=+